MFEIKFKMFHSETKNFKVTTSFYSKHTVFGAKQSKDMTGTPNVAIKTQIFNIKTLLDPLFSSLFHI
jgi:hypothetical protein